ncbi:hypothetical protein QQ045_004178 [Rhodiola kirilowii]
MMNSDGYSMQKENELQTGNHRVPDKATSSRGNDMLIQFQDINFETGNCQQLLGFPNDCLLGSMSNYQHVQDLDPYRQSGRNEGQSFKPNGFMALLMGDDVSDLLDGPLRENQGISEVSKGYSSMYGNFSEGVAGSGNNCATINTLPMASQFVAQNSSPQSPQFAPENSRFQSAKNPERPNLYDQANGNTMDKHSAARPLLDINHHLIDSASKDAFQLPEARTETEASFGQTPEFFHHTSVTQNNALKFQDNKECKCMEHPETGRRMSLGEDKQNRFQEPIDGNSSCIFSTPKKYMAVRVIKTSETPRHKTPKRRKHRPKVVKEGKGKQIPIYETQNNPKSSERPKRKYTRKIIKKASDILINRVEVETGDSSGACGTDNDNNTMERQNDLPSFIRPADMTNKLAHSMPKGTTVYRPQAVRPTANWSSTFQDLLMGNVSKHGCMETKTKALPDPYSPLYPMSTAEASMAGAQSAFQRRQNEFLTLNQQTSITGDVNQSMLKQTINIVPHAVRNHPVLATTFMELLRGNGNCSQSTVSSQIVNGYNGGYLSRQKLQENEKRTEGIPCMEMANSQNQGYSESSIELQANKGNDNHMNIWSSWFNPYPWISYATDICHSTEFMRTETSASPSGDTQETTTILTNESSKKVAPGSPVSTRKIGQLQNKDIRDMFDDTTCQLEMVPYKGDGPVVMHQAKKCNSRPKVDLDRELSMDKKGTEGVEGTNTNKEKWWEEECKLFQGRAETFICRMHILQGDRRFSLWKGSVVDSVIGVFLTQNVTDVASSSAFMDLASKFPVSASSRASCKDDYDITEEEPEICIVELEDTIPSDDSKQAISNASAMTSETNGKIVTSETEIVNSVEDHIKGANKEILSLDSSICLINEGCCSGLKSEVEDQLTTHNPLSVSETNKPAEGNQGSPRDNPLSSEKTEPIIDLNEKPGSHAVHQEYILTPASSKETTQHKQGNDHRHESLTLLSDRIAETEEVTEPILKEQGLPSVANINRTGRSSKTRKRKQNADIKSVDWDILRKEVQCNNIRWRNKDAADSMDYESMRHSDVKEIAEVLRRRGMNNMLAERIKAFLNRLVTDHGCIDLEWLRDAPPDKAKGYLLSIMGLGLKSVECVRLLTLHHLAFPVDTNVARIAVRLGWVPLEPLPESTQLHLLEMYPMLETVQKYLWPRLCKLDQATLYELHYQMITFGKVFCTKSKPNCNACPMKAECRHFASAFASARLALPGPEEKNNVPSWGSVPYDSLPAFDTPSQPFLECKSQLIGLEVSTKSSYEPIVELPATPDPEPEDVSEIDIEDSYEENPDEHQLINLNLPESNQDLKSNIQENNLDVQGDEMTKALVALPAEAASLRPQKLKLESRLRTEHLVYELPNSHPLLKEQGMDRRERDDPSPYLLAIWAPGESAGLTQQSENQCQPEDPGKMSCFSCNSKMEVDSNIVKGTLLIPCRTAMRGSFPLNGTYFQVNEMFADHESSINPIDVPRSWIWNLPKRKVYFGTAVSTIFKGMSTQQIQSCFWRGFVCVRGFDRRYRAPRPLLRRLHQPASMPVNKSNAEKKIQKEAKVDGQRQSKKRKKNKIGEDKLEDHLN